LSILCIGTAQGADVELRLSPSVCALSDDQPNCRETLELSWESDSPEVLCLFLKQQEQPLECWQTRQTGDFQYRAETDQNLVFQLRRRPGNELVASAVFEVIREHTEYRSRRRKPWNFF